MPALLTTMSTGPSFADHFGHALHAGVVVRDVPLEHGDAVLVGKRLRALVVARIVRGDFAAGLLQAHRNRLADTARSAGDNRNPCHAIPPVDFLFSN